MWGATRPGASHGRAPSPPRVVPTMVFCPSSDAAAQFSPPFVPSACFFPSSGPHKPHGGPTAPCLLSQFAPSSLPVCSQFNQPHPAQFWGVQPSHQTPRPRYGGSAARAKYSVSPNCGHPRCHPNFHPGVVGSAKPPAGHFMGEKNSPQPKNPWCFWGGEMVPKFTRTVSPGVPGS